MSCSTEGEFRQLISATSTSKSTFIDGVRIDLKPFLFAKWNTTVLLIQTPSISRGDGTKGRTSWTFERAFHFTHYLIPISDAFFFLYWVSPKNVPLSHKNIPLDHLDTAQQHKQLLRTFLWDTGTFFGTPDKAICWMVHEGLFAVQKRVNCGPPR